MITRWRIFIKAGLPENVYFEMRKRLDGKKTTINDYVNTLIMKDLGLKEKANLPPEQKEELQSSIRNAVNADLRRQTQASAVIIGRKKLSGRHAKKETNTENESNNLFTRATKGDF
jgi:hypothetical protein